MRRSWFVAGLVVSAVVIVASYAWFSPFGTGEYADSPDGRYRASASNFHRGTWFQGRIRYIQIDIVDQQTGLIAWNAERYPQANEIPPYFGDRSKKLIRWSPDSKSVTVPVSGSNEAVFVVQ